MIKPIPMDEEAREALGRLTLNRITEFHQDTQQLRDKWRRALTYYDGETAPRQFPFVGASHAWVPLTATHTDVFHARLTTGITRQDPIMLVYPAADGTEDIAREVQEFSKWVEREEIQLRPLLDDIIGTTCKFGDALVYIPWIKETKKVMSLDPETQTFIAEEIPLMDRPVPKVIAPEDFYIFPLHETNLQHAEMIGYRYEIDAPTVKRLRKQGVVYREPADRLLERLLGAQGDEAFKDGEYMKREQVGGELSKQQDLVQREREALAGTTPSVYPNTIAMAHIFARYDVDGDGIEEEINFHIDLDEGLVLSATYNHYNHYMRPFVRFQFLPRDGVFFSMGLPEMLRNIQEIYNTTMRQIIDNNTLANTQIFIARPGGPIKPNERLFPGRILFANDPKNDFVGIPMGTGNVSVRMNELQLLQAWAERRTGLTESAMGRSTGTRTPATTTMALLEQSAMRPDRIMDSFGRSLQEMWAQILQLYGQFRKTGVEYSYVLGDAGAQRISGLWTGTPPEVIRKQLILHARVSSTNLNRANQRQESMALYSQVAGNWDKILQIAMLFGQTQDPVFRELLLMQLRGNNMLMRKVLDSFDIKDQTDLNPNFEEVVQYVSNTQGLQLPAGGGPALANAQAGAQRSGDQFGPEAPPGRPGAGLPRFPVTPAPQPGEITGAE